MKPLCVHSCKGLCNALEVAEHRECEAIKEYKAFAENCDYPDVRVLLEDLVKEQERALKILQEKRQILSVKFEMTDRINDNFA